MEQQLSLVTKRVRRTFATTVPQSTYFWTEVRSRTQKLALTNLRSHNSGLPESGLTMKRSWRTLTNCLNMNRHQILIYGKGLSENVNVRHLKRLLLMQWLLVVVREHEWY